MRQEYGCDLSRDSGNELLLIGSWASAEAAAVHSQTPHFQALGELKKEYVADTVIMRYAIAD